MGNFNLKSIWKQTGGTGGSTNYFKKDGGEKQIVNNKTEFFADVIFKRRAYVDQIDEGADSSVVNQWFLNDRITKAKNQIRTENNTFTGTNTFTSNNEVIKLNSGNNNSAYIAGYKSGNSRIWYFGKGSSTSDEFIIGSTANIKLEAATNIHCNSKKLTNVADPAANTDAATKQYVDNRIKTRTETATINANSTYVINPTSGYQIINVMVGRKRSNDGMYFFEYQTTLNKQVFLDNTTFKIYNQGNVSGFSNNEFKVVITEMKV